MRLILEKIIHIVDDIQNGTDMGYEDTIRFFDGYLMAMVDMNMIDGIDRRDYKRFLESLIQDRIFLPKECD